MFGENPNPTSGKKYEFGASSKGTVSPLKKKQTKPPASAHQAAGVPTPPLAQAKPGKAMELEKEKEVSVSPMEVAQNPASAHQVAGGRVPSTSPSWRGALSSLGAKIGETLSGKASSATGPKKRSWRSTPSLLGTKPLNLKHTEEQIVTRNSFDPLISLSEDESRPIPPLYPFERSSEEGGGTEWG